ncbi:MAG: hypothetical protein JWQ32_174 [Marmoricola sp.]|nr:hypothetical protein [Marmoricola sp.]
MSEHDDLYRLLTHAILAAEVELIDGPHIVICRDVETGAAMYSGPYPTGIEAMGKAHRDQESERAAGSFGLEFSVAPLFST